MKTNNPKFAVGLAVAFCFSLLGITENLSAAIFADNFDSYTVTNRLTPGANWPSAIPDTGGQFWKTGWYGTNAIVDATTLGRSGKVYGSTRGTGPLEHHAYSQTYSTNGSYTNASWELTLDFYVDSLTGSKTTADVIDIFNTGGLGDFNSSNSISKIYLYTDNGTNRVAVRTGDTLGAYNYNYFNGYIDTGKWYTLSIEGNNTAQTLNFTLSDGVTDRMITNKYYTKDTHAFDGFVIGNTANVTSGTYYLDNISVVPEPHVSFLLCAGLLSLTIVAFRKRKRVDNL